jgi:hypothetical protein
MTMSKRYVEHMMSFLLTQFVASGRYLALPIPGNDPRVNMVVEMPTGSVNSANSYFADRNFVSKTISSALNDIDTKMMSSTASSTGKAAEDDLEFDFSGCASEAKLMLPPYCEEVFLQEKHIKRHGITSEIGFPANTLKYVENLEAMLGAKVRILDSPSDANASSIEMRKEMMLVANSLGRKA